MRFVELPIKVKPVDSGELDEWCDSYMVVRIDDISRVYANTDGADSVSVVVQRDGDKTIVYMPYESVVGLIRMADVDSDCFYRYSDIKKYYSGFKRGKED
jgi:hypothetical protein